MVGTAHQNVGFSHLVSVLVVMQSITLGSTLKIIRRYRLWESFLYRVLDYSWEDVHK